MGDIRRPKFGARREDAVRESRQQPNLAIPTTDHCDQLTDGDEDWIDAVIRKQRGY